MTAVRKKRELVDESENDVAYAPDAVDENDRAMLSEREAFEDHHPDATAATLAAQTAPDRGRYPGAPTDAERAEAEEEAGGVTGSASPREEGRRG